MVNKKKQKISEFIQDNYSDKAYKFPNEWNRGYEESKKQVEYNYQQFLNLYMEKDQKGNWQRKKDMWTQDDDGNWTPNKPKKG